MNTAGKLKKVIKNDLVFPAESDDYYDVYVIAKQPESESYTKIHFKMDQFESTGNGVKRREDTGFRSVEKNRERFGDLIDKTGCKRNEKFDPLDLVGKKFNGKVSVYKKNYQIEYQNFKLYDPEIPMDFEESIDTNDIPF